MFDWGKALISRTLVFAFLRRCEDSVSLLVCSVYILYLYFLIFFIFYYFLFLVNIYLFTLGILLWCWMLGLGFGCLRITWWMYAFGSLGYQWWFISGLTRILFQLWYFYRLSSCLNTNASPEEASFDDVKCIDLIISIYGQSFNFGALWTRFFPEVM